MFRSDGIFGGVAESGLKHRTANATTAERWSAGSNPAPPHSFIKNKKGEEMTGIIYKITNDINNKVYIGKTLSSIEKTFLGT
mgnify:CR=1 FL=1